MEGHLEQLCFEVARLSDGPGRKAFLSQFPELLQPNVVEQLADEVRTAARVDVRKALSLAEAAVAIAGEMNDDHAWARSLRAKANALWLMGDCRSAVDLFEQAAARFERAGNMNEVGRTLSTSIQSLALLGRYDNAFTAAQRAREIFASLGETWRIARLEINVANIYHRQNRFSEALASYERAYNELSPHKDIEGIGVALHNMAVCLIALDDFPRAMETYRRVHTFCEQQDMPLLVAQADYNIAYLHYLRGEYTKGLDLLRSTRETFRKNADKYHLALCELDQSDIYLELCLVKEVKDIARNSFQQFEQLGMEYEAARSLVNLAIANSMTGDFDRSLELFAQAKNKMCHEQNQVWPFLIDVYRAMVLVEQGKLVEARNFCSTAADFFRSAALPGKHVLCLLVLARILLRGGDTNNSGRRCEEALTQLARLDAPLLLYQAQFLRGQIYEATGEVDHAYNAYQAARSALESLRSSLQKEELKIGFMRNRLEIYGRLIHICLERNSSQASAEEAFSYIEAAKSRTLQDLIVAGPHALPETPQESEIDRRIRDLRKELNWYYHRIEREQLSQDPLPADQIQLLKRQAMHRERELVRLLVEAPGGGHVATALRKSSAVSLKQVQTVLGPTAALLEYFSIGERLFAAIVTGGRVDVVPLVSSAVIAHRLRMLQFQFSKFGLSAEYVARFGMVLMKSTQAHLRALFDDVFAPLEHLLNVRDLVIVPHGWLHSVPFHALFDGRQYLVDRFTLCYAPSAGIFTHCHTEPDRNTGPALILGVNDPKTPFIGEEVRAVAAAIPDAEILMGTDATEDALREKGRHSRLIHIASHGYFRQDSPMFSAICLSNSYLNLYDLYQMNLPVDLLTLSGCVTGLNVVEQGDELLGLTRGLLYAGARSLLLSLWDVDDRSTSEFMREFYSRLEAQVTKAAALRSAMLSLRERYPHPYFWAPFKLIGKGLAS
jgi:tetratricopeptide (TPR) repeat protein